LLPFYSEVTFQYIRPIADGINNILIVSYCSYVCLFITLESKVKKILNNNYDYDDDDVDDYNNNNNNNSRANLRIE